MRLKRMNPQGWTSRKKASSSAERVGPAQPRIEALVIYFTKQLLPAAFSWLQKALASARLAKPVTWVR